MSKSDGLGTSVNTVDLRTMKASHDVRAVLPGLAKQSRRWTRATICPICKGYKSADSGVCRSCVPRARTLKKSDRVGVPVTRANDLYGTSYGSGRTLGDRRTGHVPTQPPRPRMVKMADGSWAEVEP